MTGETLLRLEEKYAGRTPLTTLTPVRKRLTRAARNGVIGFNPLGLLERGEDLPKVGKRPQRILTQDEISRLIDAASSDRYRVLLWTDLRKMDCLDCWGDVDSEGRHHRVRYQLSRTFGEGARSSKGLG